MKATRCTSTRCRTRSRKNPSLTSNFDFLNYKKIEITSQTWIFSCAELRGQIHHVFRHHIELSGIGLVRLPCGSIFIRAVNEASLKSEATRGVEISDVRSHHHDLLRFQAQ